MIKTGSDILFQEPTCDTRRLRRSVVVDASADEFSIQFVAEPFAFETDQEVLIRAFHREIYSAVEEYRQAHESEIIAST